MRTSSAGCGERIADRAEAIDEQLEVVARRERERDRQTLGVVAPEDVPDIERVQAVGIELRRLTDQDPESGALELSAASCAIMVDAGCEFPRSASALACRSM